MGLTININNMTACHAGSNGTSISFPDVCKTPSPGGPIPIPYPNIAKSSDTADGSSTVKFDGNSIMLKGSNFRMSTGDEAGSAMGIVSNKIKGKAEFVNYSFDVKVEGKNVCRLLDPMQHNMGSANAFGPADLQGPLVIPPDQQEECNKVNEKKKDQEEKKTGWSKSGVIGAHQGPIQKVVDKRQIIIYFRATNPACARWISRKHRPKPHEVIDAKTINPANEYRMVFWVLRLRHAFARGDRVRLTGEDKLVLLRIRKNQRNPGYFHGIVMFFKDGDQRDGMPLLAHPKKRGGIPSESGCNYKGKWITGDYDLMDLMYTGDACERPDQNEASFAQIKLELNLGMKWDGIQHGPQAQWVAKSKKEGGHDYSSFSIPEKLVGWLNGPDIDPPKVQIAASREMPACDKDLTTVYPGGIVHLADNQDVKSALLCMGCKKPVPPRKEAAPS
jgi:hypothetical protein